MSDDKEPSPTLPDFGEPTIGSALASSAPAGTEWRAYSAEISGTVPLG